MKHLFMTIRDHLLSVWQKVVKGFWAFVAFWRAFPTDFVNFWKAFGVGFVNFFRTLPETLKSKDKTFDMFVGFGAVIIWCTPIGAVLYVLIWFLSRNG